MVNKLIKSTLTHYNETTESIEPDGMRPEPPEADKTKSISELSLKELYRMSERLRTERDIQSLIRSLKNSAGERDTYQEPFKIDTTTPINQLYHHGILGMKWGVRRYQNKDGSLTQRGKTRLDEKYQARLAGYEKQARQYTDSRRIESFSELDKGPIKDMQTSINSIFPKDDQFGSFTNDTSGSVAYELQRRGYDASAQPSNAIGKNNPLNGYRDKDYYLLYGQESADHYISEKQTVGKITKMDEYFNTLPSDARGTIIASKDPTSFTTLSFEKSKNKVYLIDTTANYPANPLVFNIKDGKMPDDHPIINHLSGSDSSTLGFIRTDNKKLNGARIADVVIRREPKKNISHDSLAHYGVLNMKWGVRRYQNKDGSRTAEGKRREREQKAKSEDHIQSRVDKSKAPSGLSNAELKRLNERLQLEETYKRLTSTQMEKSESWVKKALLSAGEQAVTEFSKGVFLGGAKLLIKELSPQFADVAFNIKEKKKN